MQTALDEKYAGPSQMTGSHGHGQQRMRMISEMGSCSARCHKDCAPRTNCFFSMSWASSIWNLARNWATDFGI